MKYKLLIIALISVLVIGITFAVTTKITDVYDTKDKIDKMKEAKILDSNGSAIISECIPVDEARCRATISNSEKTYGKEIFIYYQGKTANEIEAELSQVAQQRITESYNTYLARTGLDDSKKSKSKLNDELQLTFKEKKV